MGVSRDFTAEARAASATMERPPLRERTRSEPRSYAPHTPHPRATPQTKGRLGSQQVVSVRGRRIATNSEARRKFSAVTLLTVPLLVVGVVMAMVLSGLSTGQAFTIQNLQGQERDLKNQVETLRRDLANVQSSSDIARRASDDSMVVPEVPGILSVDKAGQVHEDRPFDPETTQPLKDEPAGGQTPRDPRAGQATSDRRATDEVGGNLSQVPGGNVLGQNPAPAPAPDAAPAPAQAPSGNLAPYAPRVDAGR